MVPYFLSAKTASFGAIALRFVSPVSLAAGLILPLAVFATKGLAPLFVVTACAVLLAQAIKERSLPPIPLRVGMALGAIVLYAAVSSAWSLTPERTLAAGVSFAWIMLGIAFLLGFSHRLDEEERIRVRTALLGGVTVGLLFLLIEGSSDRALMRAWNAMVASVGGSDLWTGNPALFSLKPAATVSALLVWPTLLSLRQRMSPASIAATVASMGAVIIFIGSDAAVLSLILGGLVFLLTLRWEKVMAPLLAAALAVFVTGAPWMPALLPDPQVSVKGIEYLPNSGVHRVHIWQVTADHIHQRPWLGHGFDTARSLYPQSTTVSIPLPRPTIGGLKEIRGEPIPLHPHNMILQIWLELGAVGAGLTLAALLAVLAALARAHLERMERAAAYGFFVTALTIAAISYGAWQAWWLSTLGLSGAILVAVLPSIEMPGRSSLPGKVA